MPGNTEKCPAQFPRITVFPCFVDEQSKYLINGDMKQTKAANSRILKANVWLINDINGSLSEL